MIKQNQILLFALLALSGPATLLAQNPHGESLTLDCAACHSPEGWGIAQSAWKQGELVNPYTEAAFSHASTDFPLTGQHASVDCRGCHATLEFAQAQTECITCHTDLHQMTLGDDCTRCHTTEHWLVDDVMQLHFDNGFPLLGNHALANCNDCHTSETELRIDRLGNDCLNCHLDEFQATTTPDHVAAGYSTNCVDCHDLASPEWQWSAGGANHLFFPLTGGHDLNDCNRCHAGGVFEGTPTDCFACHEADYQAANSPDHVAGNFPTDCAVCHTTGPGWEATDFTQHDSQYFPIFSGKHDGEWNNCNECHTTPGSFTAFSCIDCHEHNDPNDLAGEHDDVQGYSYSSQACYQCHPKGD